MIAHCALARWAHNAAQIWTGNLEASAAFGTDGGACSGCCSKGGGEGKARSREAL
jgi:hypothetical protein